MSIVARLLLFDRTCPRLSATWSAGSVMYRALGRVDAAHGSTSWDDAFAWIENRKDAIDELQFWGHGKWGCALIDKEALDARALSKAHAMHEHLEALRARLAPNALVWFRTCETFGAVRGIDFARRLSDFLGTRVAGHTFVIGFHQSGLHGLTPGATADWSADEGLAEGTAENPKRAKWSTPIAPRTITCLTGKVPDVWFTRR
jgi:hypothetical protein